MEDQRGDGVRVAARRRRGGGGGAATTDERERVVQSSSSDGERGPRSNKERESGTMTACVKSCRHCVPAGVEDDSDDGERALVLSLV
jgi:hypothetical protein